MTMAKRRVLPSFEAFLACVERGVIDDPRFLPLDAYGQPEEDGQPRAADEPSPGAGRVARTSLAGGNGPLIASDMAARPHGKD